MAKVEIFTTALCPFCYRAKRLLKAKGVDFTEVDVSFSPGKRARMSERAGCHSVPQIWINGRHVGGSEDLDALDRAGRLDELLRDEP